MFWKDIYKIKVLRMKQKEEEKEEKNLQKNKTNDP